MAAATLSSTVSAIPTPCSSSSLKARTLKTSAFSSSSSLCSLNRFPCNPISARPSCSRVHATILQDEEEKVVVEESFEFKATTSDEVKASSGEASESEPSSDFEKWVIKGEQSINVFLTDTVIKELGGNAWWFDRFLAQHIAVFYYFMTVFMYLISPRMAYHFSECVEGHAFSTYDKFIKAEGENLKKLPAPEVAVKYYTGGDLYLFDEFQTSRSPNSRRPKIENLFDVFLNIRDDEAEHCKTMKACQTHGNLFSPHSIVEDPLDPLEDESFCVAPQTDCEGIVDCITKSVATKPAE